MIDTFESVIQEVAKEYADTRLNVFDIQVDSMEGDELAFSGRVLESSALEKLRAVFASRFSGLKVVTDGVAVLRKPAPVMMQVATNLTSLHAQTSFLSEMVSQMLYGTPVEILDEQGSWVFVRQLDGYLGWTYKPYLTGSEIAPATHLVTAPVSQLRAAPNPSGEIITRVLGGTAVRVLSVHGSLAQAAANRKGWLPLADLRSQEEMPKTITECRATMMMDAARMVGVPYLWGGTSANGIDCSGLAQLLHRWVGITIPRDADMQYDAGRPVEPPFQPGDLIFFGEQGEKRSITHVGISLGGWHIMHASRARNGVYADDVQSVPHLRDSVFGACTYLSES